MSVVELLRSYGAAFWKTTVEVEQREESVRFSHPGFFEAVNVSFDMMRVQRRRRRRPHVVQADGAERLRELLPAGGPGPRKRRSSYRRGLTFGGGRRGPRRRH